MHWHRYARSDVAAAFAIFGVDLDTLSEAAREVCIMDVPHLPDVDAKGSRKSGMGEEEQGSCFDRHSGAAGAGGSLGYLELQ